MKSSSRTYLFESLENEFCPTLDSSLIAALLVEIESDLDGNVVTPTEDQINDLRTILHELSLQAEEESEFSELPSFASQVDETTSSWTTIDNRLEIEASGSRERSRSSTSSDRSFSSPLGFLQAALPEISAARLRQALEDAEKNNVDMWDIVAGILTEESIREMEERGLEDADNASIIIDEDWETVEPKRKKKNSPRYPTRKKRTQSRPKTIALTDVRQQHHVQSRQHSRNDISDAKTPMPDPWTHMASLADHLSSLLPPNPPSIFLSFFHSPEHPTTYYALHAALTSLCIPSITESSGHTKVLYNLLDVVMPEYENSDAEQRSRLISDVQLAVAVTNGKGDESLDLVHVLRDLDLNLGFGIYHLQPPDSPKANNSVPPALTYRLPTEPPPTESPPLAKFKQKVQTSALRSKPNPYQWQVVPERKAFSREAHPLAQHIPAYARDVNGAKTNRRAKFNNSSESYDSLRRRNELMRKRNEALKEATKMWKKGTSKSRSGEVALYFAERARELQKVANREALNAARIMVYEKRITTHNFDTIDLHGTTVDEAIIVVREILNESSSSISQAKPMKIITGRGTHSLNQTSVLKPAVRKALTEDGWVVGTWDGGLIVRGRA